MCGGGPFGARDRGATLGRGMGNLTLACWAGGFAFPRGQAQLEEGSTDGPWLCPRAGASPVPGEWVGGSRTLRHHCFLRTTWRRCSSLSAATMGCSFCRWWLMRWLMLSNSTSLVLTWGPGGTAVLNPGELPPAQVPHATPDACPPLHPVSSSIPLYPALTPHRPSRALPLPLPRDPPAAGAWAARCACRSARTAPGW